MAVMVRCGSIDANDPPTPDSPVLMVCPVCDGGDDHCMSCSGTGRIRVTSDPTKTTPGWAFRVAAMAELYINNGLPAVSGGQLDQANWFAQAAAYCVATQNRVLKERYGET